MAMKEIQEDGHIDTELWVYLFVSTAVCSEIKYNLILLIY